ncbi:hypothetical protein JAAARDRAFT_406172 [Jaapia argillacea MUCL 33604]|uniref:C2H2-type domain-containing protein n=1 Tax=Jaapia argillacea MUCL 33604 TaxID=933084 RepID=A0A067PVK6_9AGAM|nr:hypothetical protein JAAARDRAFT_406172 [Jaapia argillacea MUCL 33604]
MEFPPLLISPPGDAGIAGHFNNLNLEAIDDEKLSVSLIPPTPPSTTSPLQSNPGNSDDSELFNLYIQFPDEDNNRFRLGQGLGAELVPITTEASTSPTILFAQDGPASPMPFNIPIDEGLQSPIEVPVADSFSTITPTIPKFYLSQSLTVRPSEVFGVYRERLRVVTSHQDFPLSDSLATVGELYLGTPSSDFPSSNPSPSTSDSDPPPWIAHQSVPAQHALPTHPPTPDLQPPQHRRTVSTGDIHSACDRRATIHVRSKSSEQLELPVNLLLPSNPSEVDLGCHSINHDLLTPQPYERDHLSNGLEGLGVDARRSRSRSTSTEGRGGSRSRDASLGGHGCIPRRASPYRRRGSLSSSSNNQLSPEAHFVYPRSSTSSFDDGSPQPHWDDHAGPPPSPSPSPSISASSYSPSPSLLSLGDTFLPDDRGEGSSHQDNPGPHSTSISASIQAEGQDGGVELDGEDVRKCRTTRAARRASDGRRKDEYKFFCKFCKEGFTRKESLKSHYRSREGIKGFLCNLCRKPFSSKSDCNRHVKHVHRDVNSGPD